MLSMCFSIESTVSSIVAVNLKQAKQIVSKKNKAKMLVNILLKRFAFTLKASSVK